MWKITICCKISVKKFADNKNIRTFAIPFGGKHTGEMAEWSNAAVLKTVDLNGSGGSNPSLSAEKGVTDICSAFFNFSSPKVPQKSLILSLFGGVRSLDILFFCNTPVSVVRL